MKKLHLNNINPGNYSKDKSIYERLSTFNNGTIEIDSSSILVKTKDGKVFKSTLQKTEEDFMSETFQGNYEDAVAFRVIRPGGIAKMVNTGSEMLTFGSLNGDGYAVHFDIVPNSSPDKEDFNTSRDTTLTASMESKAESLLLTVDSLKDINPTMAKEHIRRFMMLVEENEIEILKFEHIQNIIYGYVLAVNSHLISENEANKKLQKLKIHFLSNDHIRYEDGFNVSGHNFVKRGVEIIPNFQQKEGYLVTIYNMDGNHPFWGNNIQMAPKSMKVINKTLNKIELRGFGHDDMGNSFKDYGITVNLSGNEIDKIILHLIDRDIDIEYTK